MIDSSDGIMDIPFDPPKVASKPVPQNFDSSAVILNPLAPLFPGDKFFAKAHKHWLLDFRTTGAVKGGGEALTELCLLEIDPFSSTLEKIDGDSYHVYINPKCTMNHFAVEANGYGNFYLKEAPLFSEIAMAFTNKVRHEVVYTKNMSLFLRAINLQLATVGLPDFKKIVHDLVNVKRHACDLDLTKTGSIKEAWAYLGVLTHPEEKRCLERIKVFKDGLAQMRRRVPAGSCVLPIPADPCLPITPEVLMLDSISRLQGELVFNPAAKIESTPVASVTEMTAVLPVAMMSSAPAEKEAERKRGGKCLPDLNVREHTVVVRNLTDEEKSAETATKGKTNVLNVSSRASSHSAKIDNNLILCQKKFIAGPGSQAAATEWRNLVSLAYLSAGYSRFSEAFVSESDRAQQSDENLLTRMRAVDLRRAMPDVMGALIEVPLTVDEKVRAMKNLLSLASTPSRGRVGIVEGDVLHQKYLQVLHTIESSPEQINKELKAWMPPGHVVHTIEDSAKEVEFVAADQYPEVITLEINRVTPSQMTPNAHEAPASAVQTASPVVVPAPVLVAAKADPAPFIAQALPDTVVKAMPPLVASFEKNGNPAIIPSVEMSMVATGTVPAGKETPLDNWIITTSYKDRMESLPRLFDPEADLRKRLDETQSASAYLMSCIKKMEKMLGI